MTQLQKLQQEILGDPEGLGYAGKADAEIVTLLNAPRDVDRTSVTAAEFMSIAAKELATLSATDIARLTLLFSGGAVDPSNADIQSVLTGILQGDAKPLVQALQTEKRTRAAQLGLGRVLAGHIEKALS